jgi:hypothetical protein
MTRLFRHYEGVRLYVLYAFAMYCLFRHNLLALALLAADRNEDAATGEPET